MQCILADQVQIDNYEAFQSIQPNKEGNKNSTHTQKINQYSPGDIK